MTKKRLVTRETDRSPRGRPRFRDGETYQSSVRLERHIKESISREFGSLANAIYFLYHSIQDMREAKGLPTDRPKTEEYKRTITAEEWDKISQALDHYLDSPPERDGRRLRPFRRILAKVLWLSEGPIKDIEQLMLDRRP